MTSPLNPDDFIITRKRKKYRFAHFANAKNCFELEEWANFREIPQDIVEIGSGTGLFLVEMAHRYPDKTFLALDVKADRLQKGARLALEMGVDNINFVRARADQLLEVVKEHSVRAVWLTFSDPFPKKRDAKRRLTHAKFLEIYKSALVDNGVFYQKTDNHALFDWSLEQLIGSGLSITELSFDLHDSNLSDDYKILTTYEKRWLSEGIKTNFVKAIKGESV